MQCTQLINIIYISESVLQIIVRRASNKSLGSFPCNFRYGLREDNIEERPRIVSPVSGTDKLQNPIKNKPRESSWHISYGRQDATTKHKPCSISLASTANKKQKDKIKHKNRGGGDWLNKPLHHKEREESESCTLRGEILYGIHPVYLALYAQRRKIHKLYYKKGLEANNSKINEILELCCQRNVEINELNPSQFKQHLKGDKVHQGIYCRASHLSLEELKEEEIQASSMINVTGEASDSGERRKASLLWLYLDQIHDPMNFGAILRSAYYFGVDKIITSKEHR